MLWSASFTFSFRILCLMCCPVSFVLSIRTLVWCFGRHHLRFLSGFYVWCVVPYKLCCLSGLWFDALVGIIYVFFQDSMFDVLSRIICVVLIGIICFIYRNFDLTLWLESLCCLSWFWFDVLFDIICLSIRITFHIFPLSLVLSLWIVVEICISVTLNINVFFFTDSQCVSEILSTCVLSL
jgi:hypothetical protein